MLSSVMKDDKCARITATVYDSSGQPAPDGTIVDFTVDEAGWTSANGSLNNEGKAVRVYDHERRKSIRGLWLVPRQRETGK